MMSKSAKAIYAAVIVIFTILILLGITFGVIEKATNDTFFINEIFCVYHISSAFMFWLGVFGDACTILIICIKKKAKAIFSVLSAAVIVLALFAGIVSLTFPGAVERKFYYESSPDGKNEIIICSYQFLIASGGDVYERVNPFFIRRLANEDKKHVEWFYDDYTIEWYDEYVTVDGYTYLLPER